MKGKTMSNATETSAVYTYQPEHPKSYRLRTMAGTIGVTMYRDSCPYLGESFVIAAENGDVFGGEDKKECEMLVVCAENDRLRA
jgi:hypothetical protein